MSLREGLKKLADLALPLTCAGCNIGGASLCGACRLAFAHAPRRCEGRADRLDDFGWSPGLPVWHLADYRGRVQAAILAAKNRQREDVVGAFREMAAAAGYQLAGRLGQACKDERDLTFAVVPAPSARRGLTLAHQLALGIREGLDAAGLQAVYANVLSHSAGHQVGKNARNRGRLQIRARSKLAGPVLLVDDVLTTGATMAGCSRVVCAWLGFVLAATPPVRHVRQGV